MVKKKICAGFDGNEHEAYIYKNINGKKYCKSCTFKLQPPKQIKKMSEKQKFKMSLRREQFKDDKEFYMKVWYERFGRVPGTAEKYDSPVDNTTSIPECEACGARLFWEPNTTYFHHILEKAVYPELRHIPMNIAIVCSNCHNRYHTFPDSVPYLYHMKAALLNDEYILGLIAETFKNLKNKQNDTGNQENG